MISWFEMSKSVMKCSRYPCIQYVKKLKISSVQVTLACAVHATLVGKKVFLFWIHIWEILGEILNKTVNLYVLYVRKNWSFLIKRIGVGGVTAMFYQRERLFVLFSIFLFDFSEIFCGSLTVLHVVLFLVHLFYCDIYSSHTIRNHGFR